MRERGVECLQYHAQFSFRGAAEMEETMTRVPLPLDVWQKVRVAAPSSGFAPGEPLRFNPPREPGVLRIAAVNFVDRDTGRLLLSINAFRNEDLVTIRGTLVRVPSRDNLDLLITGAEPVVEIDVPDALPDRPLRVEIWLKWSLNTVTSCDMLRSLADIATWRSLVCPGIAMPPPETLIKLAKLFENAGYADCADALLQRGIDDNPEEGLLLEAFAELAMTRQRWTEAVKRWQDVTALQGDNTSSSIYDRLDEAYKKQKYFPKATPKEEAGLGVLDKYSMLAFIHQHLVPELYLEIGVQTGRSLMMADCKAIGIDPMPRIDPDLFENARIIALSSDEFFNGHSVELLDKKPDMVFIDGMHLFEFVLRDFIYVERIAAPYTLVVMDDIFPAHPSQAERRRRTRAWTGDVWKLYKVLQKYRPDLLFLPINTSPTGLLLISGLKPGNEILWNNYSEIISEYSVDMQPEEDILQRKNVLPPTHPAIEHVFKALKEARERHDGQEELSTFLKSRVSGFMERES
jgi:tetratricopeptide (TPR) repeat protein